jgi:hypothetical protein
VCVFLFFFFFFCGWGGVGRSRAGGGGPPPLGDRLEPLYIHSLTLILCPVRNDNLKNDNTE